MVNDFLLCGRLYFSVIFGDISVERGKSLPAHCRGEQNVQASSEQAPISYNAASQPLQFPIMAWVPPTLW